MSRSQVHSWKCECFLPKVAHLELYRDRNDLCELTCSMMCCTHTHTHTHTHSLSLSTGGNCLLVSTRRGYRQQLTSRSPHNLFWMSPQKQNMCLSCWYRHQQVPCFFFCCFFFCMAAWLLKKNKIVAVLEPFSFSPITQRIVCLVWFSQ